MIERRGVVYVVTVAFGIEMWMPTDGPAKNYPGGDAHDPEPFGRRAVQRAKWTNKFGPEGRRGWHHSEGPTLPPDPYWKSWRGLFGRFQPLSGQKYRAPHLRMDEIGAPEARWMRGVDA
jgi:hypothetical protein